jgi:hypothetical protein
MPSRKQSTAVAKPRGDIGHGADGGIVEATLEADGAQRREAVRNAYAETNLMPQPMPRFGQPSDSEISIGRKHRSSIGSYPFGVYCGKDAIEHWRYSEPDGKLF